MKKARELARTIARTAFFTYLRSCLEYCKVASKNLKKKTKGFDAFPLFVLKPQWVFPCGPENSARERLPARTLKAKVSISPKNSKLWMRQYRLYINSASWVKDEALNGLAVG